MINFNYEREKGKFFKTKEKVIFVYSENIDIFTKMYDNRNQLNKDLPANEEFGISTIESDGPIGLSFEFIFEDSLIKDIPSDFVKTQENVAQLFMEDVDTSDVRPMHTITFDAIAYDKDIIKLIEQAEETLKHVNEMFQYDIAHLKSVKTNSAQMGYSMTMLEQRLVDQLEHLNC